MSFDPLKPIVTIAIQAIRRPTFLVAGLIIAMLGLAWPNNYVHANDERGAWSEVVDWPIIALHTVLTPDGRVLSYGSATNGDQGASSVYDVWDPADGLGPDSHLTLPNGSGVDSFCSGQLLLPQSGEVIAVGGNSLESVARFGYQDNGMRDAGDLEDARWYGTLTILPDGRLVIQGGTNFGSNGWLPSITPEISDDGVTWRLLNGASSAEVYDGDNENRWWYPRSFVAPDGRIFGITGSVIYYLDSDGDGSLDLVEPLTSASKGATSTAVMYRPGRILQVGGGGFHSNDDALLNDIATTAATIIDINGPTPVQSAATPMRYARHWANSTLLPNGDVLVTGGSRINNLLQGVANTAEIWNPDTDTWTSVAEGSVARLYHSSALLLPDGRVLVTGGGSPGPLTNLNAEVYEPPYLFDGSAPTLTRPAIVDAPAVLDVGGTFAVTVGDNETIARVTLIKTGATTHSFNMDQRFLELEFSQAGSTVTMSAPPNRNVATPGYYMLFVLDGDGTPSVGRLMVINPAT